jgi:CBS domain-containing protein/sporulation protein YlmC with PRC-barrel domain
MIPMAQVAHIDPATASLRAATPPDHWLPVEGTEGLLLLERDLLDQQIIDINGRKVVRVNDVHFIADGGVAHATLRVESVDVGLQGAIRRLLKGVVPHAALRTLLAKISPSMIPWQYVDLIETDPARRVKLKISHDKLSTLHPADIADIVEDLAPDQREAVFETLDEEVAADALEEVEDPKMKASIMESLDSDRAADIVEEMDPGAAADLLADLPSHRTQEILQEMEQEEREEVTELLSYKENTAAGRMTTEYISLPVTASAADAIEALRHYEGGVETVTTFFLIDSNETLVGTVPLPAIVLAGSATPMISLMSDPLISCHEDAKEHEIAELFDKYNLTALPVVDDAGKLSGVITSDDIINLLRSQL